MKQYRSFLEALFEFYLNLQNISPVSDPNACSELCICIYHIKISVSSQKDLDALQEKDKTLEEESKNLSELLAKQKEKYALLQVKGHFRNLTQRV